MDNIEQMSQDFMLNHLVSRVFKMGHVPEWLAAHVGRLYKGPSRLGPADRKATTPQEQESPSRKKVTGFLDRKSPCTIRQISDGVGVSTSAVGNHLADMCQRGLAKKTIKVGRSWLYIGGDV